MALSQILIPTNVLCRKTPGTEDGVHEPIPTFSTCYSAPFIVLHVRVLTSHVCSMTLPTFLPFISSARKVRRDAGRTHGQA